MPPAPTTMELARLYGIREDDPKRYRVVQASDSALKELAQFFSHYFPRLLKILHDGPPARLIYDITLHLLFHISKANLPQFTRALHRFEDASDLPTLVAKHFVHFPSTYLDDLSTANAKARNPSRDLHLLLSLVRSSINFNPAASKLNFHLDPSLLADLAQRGNHFLSTPYLQNASDDDDDEKAATLKRRLVSVLSTFGLMDLGNEKFSKQREEMLKSGGESEEIEVFRCERGKKRKNGDENEGLLLGRHLCSTCLCVAYCSSGHQKKDWKKHKLVCHKPIWTDFQGSWIRPGEEDDMLLEGWTFGWPALH